MTPTYYVKRQSVSGYDGRFTRLEDAVALCDLINQRDREDCEQRGAQLPASPDAYIEIHHALGVERVNMLRP